MRDACPIPKKLSCCQRGLVAKVGRDEMNNKGLVSQSFLFATTQTFSTQILISLLGFGSSIILARALGPEGRGAFALLTTTLSVIMTFGNLGLHISNVYHGASGHNTVADLTRNSLTIAVFVGIALVIGGIGLSYVPLVKNFLEANLIAQPMLWLVLCLIPFFLLSSYLASILLGRGYIHRYNVANIGQPALQLVFLMLFLVVFQQGLVGSIAAYMLATLGVTVIVLFWVRQLAPLKFGLERELLRKSLIYGGKANIGHIAQFLNYRLDMFLVAYFLGPTAVGFYAIAVGLAEKLWMIPSAIGTVLFPKVSAVGESKANSLTANVTRHATLLVALLALGLASLAHPLIVGVYGPAFAPSVLPFLFLLPGVVALGIGKILANDLAGRGKPGYWTIGAWGSLGMTLVLDLGLIPRWGLVGAAIASSLSYGFLSLIVLIAFKRMTGISFRDLFIVKNTDVYAYKKFLGETVKKARAWRMARGRSRL